VESADEGRLSIAIGSFVEVDLPDADLVYAQMSLPFAGRDLDEATDNALSAVKPGGVFAGHFFGANDEWIDDANVASVDQAWIKQKFRHWTELALHETDQEGPFGLEGNVKHWHYFFVLARR